MQDMSEKEQDEVLHQSRLGHLGLAAGGRCYVLPVFYGYDGDAFFFHGQPGVKDEFIDETQEACLAVSSVITPDDWSSVQVFGPVEKCDGDAIDEAEDALADVPLPAEFAPDETSRPSGGKYYWRLTPRRMSGKKSAQVTRASMGHA